MSVTVKPSSAVRVGIDYDERVFVVFRYTWGALLPMPNGETFHGYVTPWGKLTQEMKNALIRARMATRAGKIL